MRGSARSQSHAPRSRRGIFSLTLTAARLLVSALMIGALTLTAIVDYGEVAPPLQLVDESRDGGTHPSGPPTPAPSTPTPSPSEGLETTPPANDAPPEEEESDGVVGALSSIPVAAQAGLSIGVILLAVLALLPGRRPPSNLRAG
ncbi:MAG TPA: hypothetical protein H9881_03880 [Candidatus Stackebrandtia excrementipullorum]|nr:hypothetical protein [Candidatus Stackebrandtia excrementipullorum]